MPASVAQAEIETRRAASLRRIAIVLRDLPDAVAARLLSDLNPETRQRLRHEVMSLVDVDPMERKRALESFSGTVKRQASGHGDPRRARFESPDEIVFSQASQTASQHSQPGGDDSAPSYRGSNAPHYESNAPDANLGSLDFLEQISDEDLLGLLRDERPQTQAVVFASIPPSRAAAILPQVDGGQRRELLSRIGRLEELPGDMLADLADSFRQRVERLTGSRNRNPLQTLIDAYADGEPIDPGRAAHHVPSHAARVSPRLQAILAEMPANSPAGRNGREAARQRNRRDAAVWDQAIRDSEVRDSANANLAMDGEAARAAQRLRQITRGKDFPVPPIDPANSLSAVSPGVPSRESRANPSALSDPQQPAASPMTPVEPESDLSTDGIHQELIRMPAKRLCEALGRVGTRTAILTLCGLPNRTADAAIACLPRAQANQVRQHLLSVGSLEIREIDQAKQEVFMAAQVHVRVDGNNAQSIPTPSPARREVAMAS